MSLLPISIFRNRPTTALFPKNVTLTSISLTSATVTWTDAPSANSVTVLIYDSATSPVTTGDTLLTTHTGTISGTAFTISGTGGHYYAAVAIAKYTSAISNSVQAPATPPYFNSVTSAHFSPATPTITSTSIYYNFNGSVGLGFIDTNYDTIYVDYNGNTSATINWALSGFTTTSGSGQSGVIYHSVNFQIYFGSGDLLAQFTTSTDQSGSFTIYSGGVSYFGIYIDNNGDTSSTASVSVTISA